MADKNPAEKSGFDFFDGFVLAEELGNAARHLCAKSSVSCNWKKT
jgi:hypothetical protein